MAFQRTLVYTLGAHMPTVRGTPVLVSLVTETDTEGTGIRCHESHSPGRERRAPRFQKVLWASALSWFVEEGGVARESPPEASGRCAPQGPPRRRDWPE